MAEIIADIRLGGSVALIAEDAGTSKQAVYRELGRNGFRLNAGNIGVAPYADTPQAFTARLEAVAAIEAQVAEIIARRQS